MRRTDKVDILLVDDHPPKLLTYEAMLDDLGENLIKASSSTEALEQLLKNDVAVILMDVNMPGMDGFEVADIIRQHPRFQDTAIIFISAVHQTDMDRLKGYQRGALDYISVPVVPEVLRAKVSVFVDLYRKGKELERVNRVLEQRVRERNEKLWESESQFRTLANSIPQLAWIATPDGSRFWHNQRWSDYTGASPDQMDADGWLKYHHPEHTDRIIAGFQRAQETCAEWEDIHPIRGRRGEYRWFLSRAVPILDSQHRIVRWFGTATDMTGQIEAEERIADLNRALKQQTGELKTVIEMLPVGVAVTQDVEGKTISGNPALYEMLGMRPDEDISKSETLRFEVFHDANPVPPDQMPMQKALRTKATVNGLEMEIRRPDGKVLHAIINANPLIDETGQVRGAVAAYFDISQRRLMEKLLRERVDLIDLAPEAIIVRDELGLIRFWSAGAEVLYGWKRSEVLNQNMHYTLATRFPVPYSEIEASLEETGNWEGNLIQTTKDGREVTVACRKTLKSEGGTSRAILDINRNITDELRLQEMLRRTG